MEIYLENFQDKEDVLINTLAEIFSIHSEDILITKDFYADFIEKKIDRKVVCEIKNYNEYNSKFCIWMEIHCYLSGGINLWRNPNLLYSTISRISQRLETRCMISYRVNDCCMYLFDPIRRHQKVATEGIDIMTINRFLIDLRFSWFCYKNSYVKDLKCQQTQTKDYLIGVVASILGVDQKMIINSKEIYHSKELIYLSFESCSCLDFEFPHRLWISLPINKFFQPMEPQWIAVNDLTFSIMFSKAINSACLIQDLSLAENQLMQVFPDESQSVYHLYFDRFLFA